MKKTVLLSCICLLLFVSLAASPVLAATTVICPSSCSCLLPAEADTIGSPGYCSDTKKICAHDNQKNEKYCYEKPATKNPVNIITTYKLVVPTTTVPPQKCSSGCTCLSSADGKGKGLLYCGGKQVVCGYQGDLPLYCFAPQTTQTTAPPQKCSSGCTCLSSADGKGKGLLYCGGNQVVCGYSKNTPLYCFALPTTTPTITNNVPMLRLVTTTPTKTERSPDVWSNGSVDTWVLPEPYYAVQPCEASCTCLDPAKSINAPDIKRCGNATSLPCNYSASGNPMYCYTVGQAVPAISGPLEKPPGPVNAEPPAASRFGIIDSFINMFSGIFGQPAPKSPTIEKPAGMMFDPSLVRPLYSYPVATTIHPGATVYIGEEHLNVTDALFEIVPTMGVSPAGGPRVPGATRIGWFASDPYTTSPTRIINLGPGSRYRDLLISPADFVGYTGTWYVLYSDGSAPAGPDAELFTVRDPALSLSVTNAATGASVSGATVTTGDQLRFSITKNIGVHGPTASLREPLTNSVNDGFMDIVVTAPGGSTLTQLDVMTGHTPGVASLSRICWELAPDSPCNPSYTWNTGATFGNGTAKYPPGTYTVQVISKLNNMHNNYLHTGALYEGKTASQRVSFTLG